MADELVSWKEIAAHLGVSVKTAQVWELQRGLPVHRLPGPRGQVRVLLVELEAWRSQMTPSRIVANEATLPPRRLWSPAATVSVVLAPILSGAFTINHFTHRQTPFAARIEEHALVALDIDTHELWRHHFPPELSKAAASPSQSRTYVGDLDGDGSPEVLFARRDVLPVGEDALICFDRDGKERWRFLPGGNVRTAEGSYTPTFAVRSLAVGFVDSKPIIVLSSTHHPYDAAQIAVLDGQGKVMGEFWHLGHLPEMLLADLNNSGSPLLYLAGIESLKKQATLIVLNPRSLRGTVQQIEGTFLGMSAKEERQFFFPRSSMNIHFEQYNSAYYLEKTAHGILAHVQERFGSSPGLSTVMYHLNRDLAVIQVGGSDQFTNDHARLYQEGILKITTPLELHRIEQAYRAQETK